MTAASLPNGWAFLTLENFTSNENNAIKRGPFGSAIKKEYFVPSGYKVYEQKNAIYNDFNIGNYFINESKFQELKDFAVKPGDIIISCSGTIGKLAIIPQNAPKGIINQALLKLSLDTRIILTKYFSYLFTSDFFQKKVLKNTRGTAIKNLESVKALKQIPFPIAPLNEQKRIINKVELLFSFLDAGVAQLRLVQGQLKRYRQAVLKAAFEGKLTQQWRKTNKSTIEPSISILNRLNKQPLSKKSLHNLPESWCWTNLESITDNLDGKRVPVSREKRKSMKGIYPYYGASGIIDHVNNYLFDGNYLLIGEDGANLLARSTPIAFQATGKFWVNNHAHILSLLADIPIAYLEHYINSINLAEYVTGTAQPKLTQRNMNKIPVPLAPFEEQAKLVEIISRQFGVIEYQEKEISLALKYSKILRNSVLSAAFRGNLVTQDSADEPAERLLERIKAERLTNKSKNNQMELSKYVK